MTVTSSMSRDTAIPFPRDSKQIFSRRNSKAAAAYVSWQSSSKEKVAFTFRLFTADNKIVSASKPQEISLSPAKVSSTSWGLQVGSLQPGIYRIDLVVNDKTCWREFIRVTE